MDLNEIKSIAGNDMLKIIFEMQRRLQGKMPVATNGIENMSDADKQNFINQMYIALQVELGEAIQETQWKNPKLVKFGWKQTQELNLMKYKEELVDALHFFVNLCLVFGITAEELYKGYLQKNKVNANRQRDGY